MTMSTRGRRTGARTAVRIGPLLAVALVTLVVTSHAGAGTVRRKCRRTCRPLVRTCAESLPLGRVCLGRKNCVKVESCARQRQIVLRHCRDEGLAYCEADWGPTVNRCSAAWAEDHRGEAEVTVHLTFEVLGPLVLGDFGPECIRVSKGAQVTFTTDGGDFSMCSLVGGVVGSPDPGSPFASPTTGGTLRAVTLAATGTFPYYCAEGAAAAGAVIVDP